jgi:type IV secretion system protein VirB6
MIFGRSPLTAGAFIWRIVRIALIYSLAFGWSDFSTIVVQTFTQGADGVASAVCTAVGGSSCGTPETSVSSTLSTLFTNAMNAGKTVAASGGWGAAIGLSLLAIVLLIATVIFITIAVTLVMIGKVALFVLLGVAPLFIAMALFNFSSVLFTGWLRTIAQYAIVPVIVYAILGFLLTLMNQTIQNLGSITDVSSGMTVIAPFLIL